MTAALKTLLAAGAVTPGWDARADDWMVIDDPQPEDDASQPPSKRQRLDHLHPEEAQGSGRFIGQNPHPQPTSLSTSATSAAPPQEVSQSTSDTQSIQEAHDSDVAIGLGACYIGTPLNLLRSQSRPHSRSCSSSTRDVRPPSPDDAAQQRQTSTNAANGGYNLRPR